MPDRAFPEVSVAVATMVAVKVVPPARAKVGVKEAVRPVKVTVPAMAAAPGPVTVKLTRLRVAGAISFVNVAAMTAPVDTPVAAGRAVAGRVTVT